jgi:hypothetical protein
MRGASDPQAQGQVSQGPWEQAAGWLKRGRPEMCLNSQAVLAVLLHLAAAMAELENKVKAEQLLAAFCQASLGEEVSMQIFLDVGVSVTPGRDATSSMEAGLLLLPLDRVVATSAVDHALCHRLLENLEVDRDTDRLCFFGGPPLRS